MRIHLPGRPYHVNLSHPQSFASEQRLPGLPIFFFSELFLDDMVAAGSTSPGNLYRFELHLDRLHLAHQQGFCLSAGLFREI